MAKANTGDGAPKKKVTPAPTKQQTGRDKWLFETLDGVPEADQQSKQAFLKTGRIALRVGLEDAAEIAHYAVQMRLNISSFVRFALRQYIDHQKRQASTRPGGGPPSPFYTLPTPPKG